MYLIELLNNYLFLTQSSGSGADLFAVRSGRDGGDHSRESSPFQRSRLNSALSTTYAILQLFVCTVHKQLTDFINNST